MQSCPAHRRQLFWGMVTSWSLPGTPGSTNEEKQAAASIATPQGKCYQAEAIAAAGANRRGLCHLASVSWFLVMTVYL